MAAAQPPKTDPPKTGQPKILPQVITVYKGWESSVEILETDLKVWEKAGYTAVKPQTTLTQTEKAMLLKRSMNNLGLS